MRPTENEELIDEKKQHDHRSGVGMLLYLTKHSRPDIVIVLEHSKMMDGATELHYKCPLQLKKYVLNTKEHA